MDTVDEGLRRNSANFLERLIDRRKARQGVSCRLDVVESNDRNIRLAVDRAFFALVGENEQVVPTRVGERDVIDASYFSLGCKDASATADGLRVMRKSPVLAAARELLRLGAQSDQSAASEGTDIGVALAL